MMTQQNNNELRVQDVTDGGTPSQASAPLEQNHAATQAAKSNGPAGQNTLAAQDGTTTMYTDAPATAQASLAAGVNAQPIWDTRPRRKFSADETDRWFALAFYLLGYLYVRSVIFFPWDFFSTRPGNRAGVTLFVACYAVTVLVYVLIKVGGALRTVPKASWFWLAVLVALAVAYAAYPNDTLAGYQGMVLHFAAVYWTLSIHDALVEGKSSNFLPADMLNGFVLVPFGNFFARVRALFHRNVKRCGKHTAVRVWQVVLGVLLLVPILAVLLPLLIDSDENFAQMLGGFGQWWENLLNENIGTELLLFVFGLPVGAYLYGLLFGARHRSCTGVFVPAKVRSASAAGHAVPDTSVHIALGGVCVLYGVYLVVQSRTIFSAFAGQLYGTGVYSEYARAGFFSLCTVAVINACLLLAANLLAKTPRLQSRALRVFNAVLAGLTLLMLASATAKMFMYVDAYGLTARRVLVLAFLVYLALVFVAVLVWQVRAFSIVRFALVAGAVLFCVLALMNLDGIIETYNAVHFPQEVEDLALQTVGV